MPAPGPAQTFQNLLGEGIDGWKTFHTLLGIDNAQEVPHAAA
jgi:hypothetical protein